MTEVPTGPREAKEEEIELARQIAQQEAEKQARLADLDKLIKESSSGVVSQIEELTPDQKEERAMQEGDKESQVKRLRCRFNLLAIIFHKLETGSHYFNDLKEQQRWQASVQSLETLLVQIEEDEDLPPEFVLLAHHKSARNLISKADKELIEASVDDERMQKQA